jgi:hypothetical protein
MLKALNLTLELPALMTRMRVETRVTLKAASLMRTPLRPLSVKLAAVLS